MNCYGLEGMMAARKRTKKQREEDLVMIAEIAAAAPPFRKQRELAVLFGVSQQQIAHDQKEIKPFFDECHELWRKGMNLHEAWKWAARNVREHYLGKPGEAVPALVNS